MEIMITLYQFPAAYGLSSMSPFCTKVEVYFKLADIDYYKQQKSWMHPMMLKSKLVFGAAAIAKPNVKKVVGLQQIVKK